MPVWLATVGQVAAVRLGRQRSPQHYSGPQMRFFAHRPRALAAARRQIFWLCSLGFPPLQARPLSYIAKWAARGARPPRAHPWRGAAAGSCVAEWAMASVDQVRAARRSRARAATLSTVAAMKVATHHGAVTRSVNVNIISKIVVP